MNIFVLDNDPVKAAQYHCDKHIVKMPTESAMMVSSVQRYFNDAPLPDFLHYFDKRHWNHPCTIWTRESLSNFIWHCNFGIELYKEYQYRYNQPTKHQRCLAIFQWSLNNLPKINDCGLTPFAKAFKYRYPHLYQMGDTVQSYRCYYREDKLRFASWKNREKPSWL